ncbi:RagB/SusD family nutrient uptake outer membrane protein [Myroides pelagicus]|uniref:RagB/SusD family nutrient uptake outer membrane protein n=2 Tax=Myroides pelagicus TaxID=270914 RepID=A0A7K1GQ70_9FLAO|nr:RagB/SusD family nutrient uptake outer membrane protein [Myroides pelagicus]
MLDIDPTDNVDSEHIYKSVKNFEQGVLGAYSDLNLEYNALIGSILADENKLAPENNGVDGYAVNLHRWTFASDDDILLEVWKNYYNHIYSINTLLENVHKVPATNTEETNQLNNLIAELHGLRALIHFELHRVFGAGDYLASSTLTIPYVTKAGIFQKPGKITLSEYYLNLWKDIEQADELTGAYTTGNHRLTKMGINALASRVALYQKNYILAIKYSTEVIDNAPLANVNTYANIWTDTSNDEVIFKLKRNTEDKIRPNTLWYNYATGKTLFYASNKLKNQYNATTDVRYATFIDEDDNRSINKYGGNENSNRINDYKVFRSSEALLIRAESYFQQGAQQQALEDINTLRNNRFTQDSSYTALTLENILNERMLELPFEGHRYFDSKRLGKAIQRDIVDLITSQDQKVLEPNDENYQLPIPQKEIQANPNLK